MTRFLALLLAGLLVQAKPAGDEDTILLSDGTEVLGRATGLEQERVLVVTRGDRTTRYAIEEVSRIQLAAPAAAPEPPTGQRFLLEHGAILTGKLVRYGDDGFSVETPMGRLSVPRAH